MCVSISVLSLYFLSCYFKNIVGFNKKKHLRGFIKETVYKSMLIISRAECFKYSFHLQI